MSGEATLWLRPGCPTQTGERTATGSPGASRPPRAPALGAFMRRSTMAKLCCFLCPKADYTEKSLEDVCPSCGNKYGFPLISWPETIRDYKVIRPLSRGFYAATFVAQRPGMLTRPVVLKVVSKAVYDFFRKDFAQECQDNAKVADGSEHVVQIEDAHENIEITFGECKVTCHV